MSHGFGLAIESLVALLLLLTIGYCVILNRRLKRLRADEMALKATISELITATDIAERAVAGLKVTAHECEGTLGERLIAAARCCEELNRLTKSGEHVLDRIGRVVLAARPLLEPAPAPPPAVVPVAPPMSRPNALAEAARILGERTRERASALAA